MSIVSTTRATYGSWHGSNYTSTTTAQSSLSVVCFDEKAISPLNCRCLTSVPDARFHNSWLGAHANICAEFDVCTSRHASSPVRFESISDRVTIRLMAKGLHTMFSMKLLVLVLVTLSLAILPTTVFAAAADTKTATSSAAGSVNWKCPPNQRVFCTLPAAFPDNVVTTGGASGCIPGARMRANAQCQVKCKPGTVPSPAGAKSVCTYR